VLGRETFLAGITWVDGWPLFDEQRYDVPLQETSFEDDFSSSELHPRWVVPHGESDSIAQHCSTDGIHIRPLPSGAPGLLCARVRDHEWSAEAVVRAGALRLRLDDRHWYGLLVEEGVVRATARIGDVTHELAAVPVREERVLLRIESVPPASAPVPLGHAGPDEIVLSVHTGPGWTELGRLDGRYLSTEVASGFTGRMLAVGAASGPAHVHSVSYRPGSIA
jgi:hypothetical protein